MLRTLLPALFFILPFFPLKAQFAVSAEVLMARPLYFEQEETGITTRYLQKGFRTTGYYYDDFDADYSYIVSMRYTHHFATTDSAMVEVYNPHTAETFPIYGSAKSVFNSIVPQFGFNFQNFNSSFLSCRFGIGIGASWARALYEFPTYDSLRTRYSNAPWGVTGKYNAERKLVAVRPCMALNFAVQYEFTYFCAYGNLDISYSMGEFPPSPVSIGAGILFPLSMIQKE